MSTNIRSKTVPFLLAAGLQRRVGWVSRLTLPCALTAVVVLATGCAQSSLNDVTVEDRKIAIPTTGEVSRPALPGIENAGKPGYYTVQPGDTVFRIARENNQSVSDIVRWNGIGNSNLIEVGQVVRVVPPGTSSTAVARPAVPIPADTPVADVAMNWMWPAQGTLIAGFSEVTNKGLDIAGKAGDAVMASADGRVVYAGAGLRGYGNLVILKHNDTFMTAYAHNRVLLVTEDQAVKRGQKIAEMGSTDTDRVKLHFEIRRQSKPVDPAKYLPAR